MVKFNNNLNNLFKNYQQQQKYAKKAFDVNGDGKINSKDKKELENKEKNLLKKSNLFDINGDGKFNQKDVDMFVKGDVNGNGKVTKEELNFISYYKVDFKSAMTKAKADFTMDGKKYVKGKLANGIVGGLMYQNGILANNVTINGKMYVKGKLANGIVSGLMYQNGILANNVTINGKMYVKGKLANDKVNGKMYQAGVLANNIVVKGIFYKNGVPSAGTVNSKVIAKASNCDISTVTNYDTNGKKTSTLIKVQSKNYSYMLPQLKGLDPAKITKVSCNKDKSFTVIADGKEYRFERTKVSGKTVYHKAFTGKAGDVEFKDGVPANGEVNSKMYENGFLKTGYVNGVMYKEGVIANGEVDGRYYQNGIPANGTIDGKLYQNGVLANGIVDNKCYFMGNETKDEVTVCGDNNIRVISEDGNTLTKYYADGSFMYSMTREEAVNQLNKQTKNYINRFDSATINDRLFKDLDIINTAEYLAKHRDRVKYPDYYEIYSPSIKAQMISTPGNMKNEVGEVVEKEDGLYVNDGNSLVKLNISAGTYLRLFPPKERYQLNQGGIGDCFLVSACLIDMIKSPKAFSHVLQMFSEKENGDIEIELKGSFKEYSPINFENGTIKSKSPVIGSTGIRMLEQAYAIANFAHLSQKTVEHINIGEAIESISNGGSQEMVYKEVLGLETDIECITLKEVSEVNINETALKRDAEKYESHIIDFLENRIKYTECCSIFDNYDYMTDTIKQIINCLMYESDGFKHYLNLDNELWEECYTDKKPNVEKFKEFLNNVGFDENVLSYYNVELNDSQWTDIITLLNETDYKKIYGDFSYSDIILSADLRHSRNTIIGDYVRNACNISDINEMKNYLNTMKNQNFYEIVLESETKKQTENKLNAELNNENTIKTLENLSKLLNEDKALVSISFSINMNSKQDLNKYNIVESHAFSIEKIDMENQIIYTNNPWFAGGKIAVPFTAMYDMSCTFDIGYLE